MPAPDGYPGYDIENSVNRTIHLWWGERDWGYRHIVTKRGYGPTDEIDTAQALRDPDPIEQARGNEVSWLFQSFYSVFDGETGEDVQCVRSVVVNFFHRAMNPAPMDIITSFYGSYDQ
jgi:hypothetical protein